MKVVLDTNIVVAAYLAPMGPPARILAHWRSGAFDLLLSEPILREYERVLASPRIAALHGLSAEEIAEGMAGFRQYAVLVEPGGLLRVVADDPDDDKFFEAAIAGGATYLVSRDESVLAVKEYRGIRVVSPEVFMALLEGA